MFDSEGSGGEGSGGEGSGGEGSIKKECSMVKCTVNEVDPLKTKGTVLCSLLSEDLVNMNSYYLTFNFLDRLWDIRLTYYAESVANHPVYVFSAKVTQVIESDCQIEEFSVKISNKHLLTENNDTNLKEEYKNKHRGLYFIFKDKHFAILKKTEKLPIVFKITIQKPQHDYVFIGNKDRSETLISNEGPPKFYPPKDMEPREERMVINSIIKEAPEEGRVSEEAPEEGRVSEEGQVRITINEEEPDADQRSCKKRVRNFIAYAFCGPIMFIAEWVRRLI